MVSHCLRKFPIAIASKGGHIVNIEAVIQDGLPEGSNIGTVVALHGVPGSHNDFKYITPLLKKFGCRVIAVDFPGFGKTPSSSFFSYNGDERVKFVQQVINRLDVDGKLIFLGHSRGTETALRLGALNKDRTLGIVLVNPVGLRPHRGVKPFLLYIRFLSWLWESGRIFQVFLRPFLLFFFRWFVQLKVNNGDEAANCVLSINGLNFSNQIDYIKKINESNVQVFIAYSSLDPLIETEISNEVIGQFENMTHICLSSIEQGDSRECLYNILNNYRNMAIDFGKGGHFQQKYNADYIVDIIKFMLK